MQTVQYENLKDKITEARRAKHDVRHHIALMQEYLNDGDYDSLKKYLKQYGAGLPDDSLVNYCENTAANAVLLYFAQQAENNGIDYVVNAKIPNKTVVSDTDISVLFGNLLENALDACKSEMPQADRKIVVRADADVNSLCITVDNTYKGKLRQTDDGYLISTKHRGIGLGTQSVKGIAEQYNGVCKFETYNGMFCASVLCQINK